jgi:signal transduction histidine kinase
MLGQAFITWRILALSAQSQTKITNLGLIAFSSAPVMATHAESNLLEASAELERLQRELKSAEQLLACFRQAMGHDMPNHLVAIRGLVRLLEIQEKDGLAPASQEYLQRVTAVTERAESLMRMLAEICKVGRRDRLAESVLLGDVAQEAAAQINQLFPGRAIEYHLPEQPFLLTALRPDVRQVLVQLMRNAVQASPEGRPVHIELGTRQTSSVREFWVADRGQGISSEQREHLKDFLSGELARNPGNGLGLVLVRRIVDYWGGSIRMESEPGGGTTVVITL